MCGSGEESCQTDTRFGGGTGGGGVATWFPLGWRGRGVGEIGWLELSKNSHFIPSFQKFGGFCAVVCVKRSELLKEEMSDLVKKAAAGYRYYLLVSDMPAQGIQRMFYLRSDGILCVASMEVQRATMLVDPSPFVRQPSPDEMLVYVELSRMAFEEARKMSVLRTCLFN